MGDPSATKDKAAADRGLNSESRATTAESRGLDAALAGQRRRRRKQPLLDRDALAEEMRRSRVQADRVQQREAEAARRRQPPDDVRIEPASRDPFGALEVGAENVPDPSLRDGRPERSGIPPPPPGVLDLDLEKALAEITRRQRENPPKDPRLRNVIQLGDLFEAIPQQTRERILAALRAPRPLPKVKPPQEFSLQEGVRLLGRTKIGALRQAGAKIHPKYGNELPLNHKELNTVIYYVGPGVGVLFTPTGDMVEFPFGTAFDIEAVHEWAKPNGGIFFSLSMRETVRLYSEVEYRETIFRVKTGGPLREWQEIDRYTRNRAILFIISPSYFRRRSFRSAFTGLPGRARQAARLAIDNDYLLYAAGDQAEKIQNMDAGDIASTIVELAIDVLSPFPSYEDLQDMKRLGRANIMAMWGANGPYINSDLDIAARLYAREAAAQILGIGFKAAKKIAKKVDGSLGKGGDPKQADIKSRDPATADSPQTSMRSKQPDQPPEAIGDGSGSRRGESELSPEAQARSARMAEEELRQGISRRPDNQTPTRGRATADSVQQGNRQTADTNAARPARFRREGPPPGGRPRGGALDKDTLDKASDQLEAAESYWAQLPDKSQKTVAHSEGRYTQSGYGYSKRSREFPQRKAPEGESEASYYVHRYEELSGQKPPRGNDNEVAGDEFAAHAEVKDRIHQSDDGTNTPTGVSQDMCGNCRKWHRDTAVNQGEQIVVADPNYTRAFNPDGTVDIYTPDGDFVRTIPSNVEPAAGRKKNYEGVEW